MIESGWKTLTLDYDRDVTGSFSGDDADRYTELCDLGKAYEKITVVVPALSASATIAVYIQMVSTSTTVPVAWHHGQVTGATPAFGTAAYATTSGAGSYTIEIPLPGVQYFRLYTSANQAANRTFYVRGVRS